MLFNTLGFLAFLILVLTFYYLPLLSWKGKKGMLLLASYIFYGLWNPPLIILLWISTLVDWKVGNILHRTEASASRKLYLGFSILVNLGFLTFFKYGNFLLENFNQVLHVLGVSYTAPALDILLPMGISFYTFQTMSYSIDLYYRKIQPARSFLDFALYVSFFPQLVAGPIVRSPQLIPQFYAQAQVSARDILWGSFLLTLGLFQKMVMADTLLSGAADKVFAFPAVLHPLDAWAGTLAFSGQIFFDFAGYSMCAIGIARLLGMSLPDNFKYPYAAIGFSDFWRRWHITLSTWLRDYLYIPLGGNRGGLSRTYINLMITMLLGGLWHGAAWTFIFWGFLHGLYLSVERLLRNRISIRMTPFRGFMLAFLTYTLINITWVFFRAPSFAQAFLLLLGMFSYSANMPMVLDYLELVQVYGIIGGVFLIHWFMRNQNLEEVLARLPLVIFGLLWGAMLILIVLTQGSGEQFIYFQF